MSTGVIRGLLLTLAQQLRPKVDAELYDDPIQLTVTSQSGATAVIDLTTPITTTGTHVVYRNIHSGRVYGTIAQIETVADRIREELDGHG